ncbi:hypothetical protein FQA47_007528 [Oryzias melastigma]|uniref:Uncharacterized protein n=1 Tax=Oryzias melastigma TaxID=30732 RepID=A0A834CB17_ORYME|nr:hypothetical protein FQA47_007528 [Oryzias melastigma]
MRRLLSATGGSAGGLTGGSARVYLLISVRGGGGGEMRDSSVWAVSGASDLLPAMLEAEEGGDGFEPVNS